MLLVVLFTHAILFCLRARDMVVDVVALLYICQVSSLKDIYGATRRRMIGA